MTGVLARATTTRLRVQPTAVQRARGTRLTTMIRSAWYHPT
jgi:hypothetical protein